MGLAHHLGHPEVTSVQPGDSETTGGVGEEGMPSSRGVHFKDADPTVQPRDWRKPSRRFRPQHLMSAPILLFIGDGRVGTTSLLKQVLSEGAKPENSQDVAKVARYLHTLFSPVMDCDVTFQVWDVEGGDVTSAMACARRAHAVTVVYDITNRTSFETAQGFLDNVNPRASVLLIGNKLDLKQHRRVSSREGELLARIHRVKFMETSAKLSINVEEAFKITFTSVPVEYLTPKTKSHALRRWHVTGTAVHVCAVCNRRVQRHKQQQQQSQQLAVTSPDNSRERAVSNQRVSSSSSVPRPSKSRLREIEL